MSFKTITTTLSGSSLILTLNRSEHQNSINSLMLDEINQALDLAENNPLCRIVIFQGKPGLFSSGMDLQEVGLQSDAAQIHEWATTYMDLLKRLNSTSKVIATLIDGKAIAGALGFIAASDWVIATDSSHFKLSEALWGLLPAMISPYLIRRMGYQKTYSMALTCRGVTAQEAQHDGLIDEINNNLDEAVEKLSFRINRITEVSVKNTKEYFKKLHPITEEIESLATQEITSLLLNPVVQARIRNNRPGD